MKSIVNRWFYQTTFVVKLIVFKKPDRISTRWFLNILHVRKYKRLNAMIMNNWIIKSINKELLQVVFFTESARIFIEEWNKYIIMPVAASPRLPSHSICPFNNLCLLHSIWTSFGSWISKDTRTRVCLSLIKSSYGEFHISNFINSWDIGVLLRRNVSPFDPFRIDISKNPFLSLVYVIKEIYCPNFTFLGTAIWAER